MAGDLLGGRGEQLIILTDRYGRYANAGESLCYVQPLQNLRSVLGKS
ncbi:MAG: hypothetical protein HC786_05645 [Richelia sp. CSU_2_1]|nr:hypothetical protein [Microcoleus sp. SU_5_6]NJL69487.1 hypothetical protein [Microcoleus sp. SM1_3_4]NJR21683.1 hypothetical protein [Richelia sp. CSU_2_1]